MRKISKRSAVVLGAAGVVVVAGVAYAAWTSTGSGSGTVTSTTSVASAITTGGTDTQLYPGAVKDFTVSIDNPNDYPVVVTGISAGASLATGTGNACVAGTVTSAADTTPPNTTIAAHGSGTYTLHAQMAGNADNACKSQTFTLPLTATLASNA